MPVVVVRRLKPARLRNPVNRHFYVFEPPRELAEIDADLKKVTDRIKARIEGLTA